MSSSDSFVPAVSLQKRAVAFCIKAHANQVRGDGVTPYWSHPIGVWQILWSEATLSSEADADVLAASMLHDILEDTDTTYETLVAEFGKTIADLVNEVTDPKGLTKEQQRKWQVEHAPQLSPGARLIKLADKLYNLRDLRTHPPTGERAWSNERKREYVERATQIAALIAGTNAKLDALMAAEIAMH